MKCNSPGDLYKRLLTSFLSLLSRRASATLFLLLSGSLAFAQLAGSHLLGDAGLQAGTQSEPSVAPLLIGYNYHTKTFIDADKDERTLPTVNYGSLIAGGMWVTNLKLLGAHVGGCALIAFTKSKIEGAGVSSKSSFAFSDSYITPIQLGWSTDRADFMADYSLYIPTGKYELNGEENTGMGMWTHEFSVGSTFYFDAEGEEERNWSISALLGYAINSKKINSGDNRIVVGNHLTVEGGLGKTWNLPAKKTERAITIGAGWVYYMQFKTTKDQMDVPELRHTPVFLNTKDYVLSIGFEGNVYVPRLRTSVSLRWFKETNALNRMEGNSFLLTLIPYVTELHPKKEKKEKEE